MATRRATQGINIFLQNPANLISFIVANNFATVNNNLQNLTAQYALSEDQAVQILMDWYNQGDPRFLQAIDVNFIPGNSNPVFTAQLEQATASALTGLAPQRRNQPQFFTIPEDPNNNNYSTPGDAPTQGGSFWEGTNFMDIFNTIFSSNAWNVFGGGNNNTGGNPNGQPPPPQQDNTLLYIGGFFVLIIFIMLLVLLFRGGKNKS